MTKKEIERCCAMPTVNLTVEQLVAAVQQLEPEELEQVKVALREKLGSESEEEVQRTLVAAAVEAADW
jgi:hypothetical protein